MGELELQIHIAKTKLKSLQDEISAHEDYLRALHELERKIAADRFIKVQPLTLDDIERMRPQDDHLYQFIEFLRTSTKPYAEWNDLIFSRLRLIADGDIINPTPIRIRDLN